MQNVALPHSQCKRLDTDSTAPPTVAEAIATWAACVPCSADRDVIGWLRQHALDVDAVDDRDLARALPRGRSVPACAASWAEDGYRIVLPLHDAIGHVVGLRARRTGPPRGDTPRPVGTIGAGLVYANELAIAMLSVGRWPWWTSRTVVVVGGEIAYLVRASTCAVDVAVIGLGAWSPAVAARVPASADVVLRMPPTPQGDRAAVAVASTLRRRCRVREADERAAGRRLDMGVQP
jgi:hypothetical protein